jgi:hypothetical protein
MKVLLSGQMGLAALTSPSGTLFLSIESPGQLLEDTPYLHDAMRTATDVIALDLQTPAQVMAELELAWACDRCLHLILLLLDMTAGPALRSAAAEHASRLFEDIRIAQFIRNRFYSAPMPENVNLANALNVTVSVDAYRAEELLRRLIADQGAIRCCRAAWEDVASQEEFAPTASEVFRALVSSGAFYELAWQAGQSSSAIVASRDISSIATLTKSEDLVRLWQAKTKELFARHTKDWGSTAFQSEQGSLAERRFIVPQRARHAPVTAATNRLLFAKESSLSPALKQALLARRELRIGYDGSDAIETVDDYARELDLFLEDPNPDAGWLFAVQPESIRLSTDRFSDLADRLEQAKKRIVFFESGHQLCRPNRVFVIRTEYTRVLDQMVRFIDEFTKDSPNSHVVTLLPPREYMRVRHDHETLLARLAELNSTLSLTTLKSRSWSAQDAEDATSRLLRELWGDPSPMACFICGSDEIALGAYEAVLQFPGGSKAIDERKVSFIGFDSGVGRMCDTAVQIVREPLAMPCDITIESRLISPVE